MGVPVRALVSVDVGGLLVDVATSADRHPALVYLARLGLGSRRATRQRLDRVAALLSDGRADHVSLPWASLRYAHVAGVRAALLDVARPATVNATLSAVRGVLQEARRLGQLGAEDCALAGDVPRVRTVVVPAGRALSAGELGRVMEACGADSTPAGVRDAALVALLARGGLRRAEAVALQVADYVADSGLVTVRSGKGGRDRTTYLDGGARLAVDEWLMLRGLVPGALVCPVTRAGEIILRGLTPQAVYLALRRRAVAARVGAFSPHDLRRTYISDLLDAGCDIVTVQRMVGHAGPETTARYDRRGEAVKRRAASLLLLPYVSRGR